MLWEIKNIPYYKKVCTIVKNTLTFQFTNCFLSLPFLRLKYGFSTLLFKTDCCNTTLPDVSEWLINDLLTTISLMAYLIFYDKNDVRLQDKQVVVNTASCYGCVCYTEWNQFYAKITLNLEDLYDMFLTHFQNLYFWNI